MVDFGPGYAVEKGSYGNLQSFPSKSLSKNETRSSVGSKVSLEKKTFNRVGGRVPWGVPKKTAGPRQEQSIQMLRGERYLRSEGRRGGQMSRPPSMVQICPPDFELRRRVGSVDGIERGTIPFGFGESASKHRNDFASVQKYQIWVSEHGTNTEHERASEHGTRNTNGPGTRKNRGISVLLNLRHCAK